MLCAGQLNNSNIFFHDYALKGDNLLLWLCILWSVMATPTHLILEAC